MSLRLQVIIGIILILAFIRIASMVSKKKVDLRYALSWMALLVVFIVLDIFPIIVYKLTELIGIGIPSNMIFFVSVLMLGAMIFMLTVIVSKQSTNIKRLTQEVALLKDELENKLSE